MRTIFNPVKSFFILLVSAFLFVGCKSSYDITLDNGRKFSGVSKPVLDKKTGHYHFLLPDGQETQVLSTSIRLIEPHGDSSEPQFVSPTKKK